MNIKEAKKQIADTLKAYLARDEYGNYLIPPIRQRPVLLLGAPGIGKTQIMEQIASEENVGLVAYTITHHTRQSAIGLPYIEKRIYGETEYTVTEYTMSEIIGAVYSLIEKTGIKEGILFIDEINCVSETLAPMMLQFLQCKTFGNQKLPEGWLIVAAGNPPEYNRSVREFDVVTLDRVKKITVEENFGVWKEYAQRKGLHGAVVSYLDLKKDNFYRMENTAEGLQFATPRGWEDLSEIIFAYEKLGIKVDMPVVEQYIQLPSVARDFANYLSLYIKYRNTYHIDDIFRGTWARTDESEFYAAPFDEKLSVLSLILSGLADSARDAHFREKLVDSLHASLVQFRESLDTAESPVSAMNARISACHEELKRASDAGQGDRTLRDLKLREQSILSEFRDTFVREEISSADAAMNRVRELLDYEVSGLQKQTDETSEKLKNAFAFLEASVGQSQEMVMFVTELTAGYDTSWFIENYGCEAYFRHNSELLFNDTRRNIVKKIISASDASGEKN
ncbi:MAG: AAA family ATPase [Eubacteriales bacterium]|nr:AAA family ATPase [Eubacteriales bacterium]